MNDEGILSPAAVADPYPYFARLRSTDPVHWDERYRSWFLSSYAENELAVRDASFSSDRITPVIEKERRRPDPDRGLIETLEQLDGWMVFRDAPEHLRLRRLVARAFTPRMVAAMHEQVVAVTDELLDAAERDAAATDGTVDLLRAVAYPLPAIVIAGMLGVPPEDRDQFKEWSDDISALVFGGMEDPSRHARARTGMSQLVTYVTALAARARRDPRDDLATALVQAHDEDGALSEAEVVATCINILFGGHETTTNLIANGVLALLQHPEQGRRLREDPDLAPVAVEELLRYDGPAKAVVRVAATDLELLGRRISAGDRVFLLPAAANRDPAVFERPDELDVTRHPNPHLGFGAGMHYCLGASLARLEGTVAIPRILERFPELQLTDQPLRWKPVLLTRGLDTLPVRVAP